MAKILASASWVLGAAPSRHLCVTGLSGAYGIPRHIDELGHHSCLAFVHGGRPVEWRFTVDGQVRSIPFRGRFSATNAEALRDATLAGYGIARLAEFLIPDDLRASRLVPILDSFTIDGPSVRAVYRSSRHLSPKVRSFIDELLNAWRPMPPWDRIVPYQGSNDQTQRAEVL